jgi:hypothetical protein
MQDGPKILMACDVSDAGKMAAFYRRRHKGRQVRVYTPESYETAWVKANPMLAIISKGGNNEA